LIRADDAPKIESMGIPGTRERSMPVDVELILISAGNPVLQGREEGVAGI
jgi:hypothetical protein